LNIASLGALASLAGLVGDDDNADRLTQRLEEVGVNTYFHRTPGIPTITKLRVMSRNQQLIRLDFEDGLEKIDTKGLAPRLAEAVAASDLVILSDYGKGTLSNIEWVISHIRSTGKRVLVDPKGTDFSRY